MKLSFSVLISLVLAQNFLLAEYLDNKSCKECHENIYYEYENSMHARSSLFKDEFHKKMKELNFPSTYKCARCHTPGASNLEKIRSGELQPSQHTRETDGVSCIYCHQIAKIKKSHKENINITTFDRPGKQLMYGNLKDYGDSDKHNSLSLNPIYKNSQVCMGCHSHKRNDFNDVEICQISYKKDFKSDCIKCHMPKYPGGITKINKKGRSEYASHRFLGIRSPELVKKAVALHLEQDGKKIKLTITNKMGHMVLQQPMRLKYVETVVKRDGKVIWKNFKNTPYEDKEVTFSKLFKDEAGKQVYPPKAFAIKYYNNLDVNESKTVTYEIPDLQAGDEVISTWISYPIRPSLAKELDLHEESLVKKYVGTTVNLKVQ
jgi:nitrate/TMAO reductase-like tetraheme cytochrome c subunit